MVNKVQHWHKRNRLLTPDPGCYDEAPMRLPATLMSQVTALERVITLEPVRQVSCCNGLVYHSH